MRALLSLVLVLVSACAVAGGWRYVMVKDGTAAEHDVPPADLSYPPPGEPTPFRRAGEIPAGEVLSEGEAAYRRQNHMVIIDGYTSLPEGLRPPAAGAEADAGLPSPAQIEAVEAAGRRGALY
jgi:hypothetical protein